MTSNAALLTRAIDQTNTIITSAPPELTHAPTPCDDFDVAALIEHVTTIADRVTHALAPDTPHPSSTWAIAYPRLRTELHLDPPERIVALPFGQMPLTAALGVFVGEFVTHSWDLAVAVRRSDLLDDDLAQHALAMVTAKIPAAERSRTPFGDVVPVNTAAPVHDRLAGWMGRDPAWSHDPAVPMPPPGRGSQPVRHPATTATSGPPPAPGSR